MRGGVHPEHNPQHTAGTDEHVHVYGTNLEILIHQDAIAHRLALRLGPFACLPTSACFSFTGISNALLNPTSSSIGDNQISKYFPKTLLGVNDTYCLHVST